MFTQPAPNVIPAINYFRFLFNWPINPDYTGLGRVFQWPSKPKADDR